MARLSIPTIVKRPIEAQATDALRNSIVGGGIPPGERITEVRLSEQMGLSRATVRTALHQLATEGLLHLVPYTGWSVVTLSSRDVWELYTFRSAIERLAAQLAASNMTPEKAPRIKAALATLARECERGDQRRIAEADFGLHKTIIDMAEHSRLALQYSLIEQQVRMFIRTSDSLIATARTIMEQHEPIADAILRGDVEASGRLLEEHNLVEGEKLTNHLRARETAPLARPSSKEEK